MKTKKPHPSSLAGIGLMITALVLSPCGLSTARAAGMLQLDPDKVPMTSSQLSMTVEQSGVPQVAVKGCASVTKVRAVTIKLRRVGYGDGKVTLKIAFVGTDVLTNKKVVNNRTEKEAEAPRGKDAEYTETSAPFVYNLPSEDPKTKKSIPANGTKPFGWIVRVFQAGKLLKSMSSNPDIANWIDTQ